jgi:two-component sensor histidine kinase
VNEAGPRRLRLRWAEMGGPPVTPPTRRGFGSRLVERGLEPDLGGEVRMEFAVGGLVCTIEAPLPPVDDAIAAGGSGDRAP